MEVDFRYVGRENDKNDRSGLFGNFLLEQVVLSSA